jgi:hypothetical protein
MFRKWIAGLFVVCGIVLTSRAGWADGAPPPPEAVAPTVVGSANTIHARRVDILETGRRFCADQKENAPAGMNCAAWARVGSSGAMPPGALKGAVGGSDPCKLVEALRASSLPQPSTAADLRSALLSACGQPEEKEVKLSSAGALNPATVIAVNALQGLGDYLQSLAKEELVDFAVETFAKGFCQSSGPLGGQTLFTTACPTLFPKGYDQPPDTNAVISGQFVAAVKTDALALPGVLVGELPISDSVIPDGSALREELVVLVRDLTSLAANQNASILDFLETLRADVRKGPLASKLSCGFTAETMPSAACVGALVVEVAGDAKKELTDSTGKVMPPDATSLQQWLQDASVDFCQNYGPGRPDDGSCIFGANAQVWSSLELLVTSVETFYSQLSAVSDTFHSAVKMARFRSEIDPAMLQDTAAAIKTLASGILRTVDRLVRWQQPKAQRALATAAAGPEKNAAESELSDMRNLYEVMVVAGDTIAFVSAAVKKDVSGALSAFQKILSDPLVARYLDARFAKAAAFVVALGEAKDRAAAQQVIQDAAAPMGTYRAKYDANTVMINGYVGVFGVVRIGTDVWKSDPNYPGLGSPDVRPFSAPLGLEWSYARCAADALHCGFSLVALDPLALVVVNGASGPVEADFDGVLEPGVLFHLGIAHSPIDLMAGATIQPLLKSDSRNCGASGDKACWQAPINLLWGLSVDAPLLQLH